MSKETRLSQRHDQEIIDALKTISDESGLSQKAIVAACITGLKKTWDEEKEITFPSRVISQNTYLSLKPFLDNNTLSLAAEGGAPYGKTPLSTSTREAITEFTSQTDSPDSDSKEN